MSHAIQLLKEPLQQVLRDFAYLDLELRPGYCDFHNDWELNSAVNCGGSCHGTVAVFVTRELLIRAADGMLAIESTSQEQLDVLGELANVLAGNAYEILCDGLRPAQVTTPKLLAPSAAIEIWNHAPADGRYLLHGEKSIEGGLVVAFPGDWRS